MGGLYNGTSGLALGTGLYRDVNGLWSGASGLEAGFVAAPVTATTWNPADKSASITLSGGDLVVAFTAAITDANVRSTTSHASGKWYFSATAGDMTATGDESPAFGIADGTFDLDTVLGVSTNAAAAFPYGGTYYDDTHIAGPPWVEGGDVGIAVDIDAGLLWVAVNGVFDGSPVLGTGGRDVSGVCTGEVFAAVYSFDVSTVAATNFGATAFAHAPPAGFVAWDA